MGEVGVDVVRNIDGELLSCESTVVEIACTVHVFSKKHFFNFLLYLMIIALNLPLQVSSSFERDVAWRGCAHALFACWEIFALAALHFRQHLLSRIKMCERQPC